MLVPKKLRYNNISMNLAKEISEIVRPHLATKHKLAISRDIAKKILDLIEKSEDKKET